MKRHPTSLARSVIGATFFAAVCSAPAAIPFDSATVTRAENEVAVGTIRDGKIVAKHAATISEVIKANHFVQTAAGSRAELEFKDKSLVRVGQNSIFTFDASSRTLSLKKGDMLFYVPPGSGGGIIKTPSITAAITGTLCKVSEAMIAVLRGSVLVTFNGKQIKVTAGWALQIVNGEPVLFQFDPKDAVSGKLYSMGPLPEDPGIQVVENDSKLYVPNSHDQNAQDSGQVNPTVNHNPPNDFSPPIVVATPAPTPRPVAPKASPLPDDRGRGMRRTH